MPCSQRTEGRPRPYREPGAWWRASGKEHAAPSLGRRPQYSFWVICKHCSSAKHVTGSEYWRDGHSIVVNPSHAVLWGRYPDAKELAMALAWVHKCLNWEVMEPERAWYTPTVLLASSGLQRQMLMGVPAALSMVREAGRESDVWRHHFPACQQKASKLQEHLSAAREPLVACSPPCQSDMFHCNLEMISMGLSDGESARQKGSQSST